MKYKFKVGDEVKIINYGHGCNKSALEKIVIITELGVYDDKPGYKIDNLELQTNTKTGSYNGFIGEGSFEFNNKTKPQLEVGKWYKISNNWYGKFKLSYKLPDYWQFSERITSFNAYEKYICNVNKCDDIVLLTDLSEIQPYLPDGHPDKIKTEEFVLPKKWCIRPLNQEENEILINWRGGGYFSKMKEVYLLSDKYWSKDKHGYTEITFEQFEKYVLKDSIKEQEIKTEFKNIERNAGININSVTYTIPFQKPLIPEECFLKKENIKTSVIPTNTININITKKKKQLFTI